MVVFDAVELSIREGPTRLSLLIPNPIIGGGVGSKADGDVGPKCTIFGHPGARFCGVTGDIVYPGRLGLIGGMSNIDGDAAIRVEGEGVKVNGEGDKSDGDGAR